MINYNSIIIYLYILKMNVLRNLPYGYIRNSYDANKGNKKPFAIKS